MSGASYQVYFRDAEYKEDDGRRIVRERKTIDLLWSAIENILKDENILRVTCQDADGDLIEIVGPGGVPDKEHFLETCELSDENRVALLFVATKDGKWIDYETHEVVPEDVDPSPKNSEEDKLDSRPTYPKEIKVEIEEQEEVPRIELLLKRNQADDKMIFGASVDDLWNTLKKLLTWGSEYPQFGWFNNFQHMMLNSTSSLQRVFDIEQFPVIHFVESPPSIQVLLTLDRKKFYPIVLPPGEICSISRLYGIAEQTLSIPNLKLELFEIDEKSETLTFLGSDFFLLEALKAKSPSPLKILVQYVSLHFLSNI
jgi:hypothetical protein